MSRRFERVTAVDIAPTMLEKLAANCQESGVTNCTPYLSGDPWEETGPFDLVYSHLVFQHLANTVSLLSYLGRMAAGLAADGVCHFQFDTRPRNPGYRVRNALPDRILPVRWRSGIRRIRRSSTEIHDLLVHAGLAVVDQRGSGTELHEILARRAVGASA